MMLRLRPSLYTVSSDRKRPSACEILSNAGSEKVSLLAMLRAFSVGEEAALG